MTDNDLALLSRARRAPRHVHRFQPTIAYVGDPADPILSMRRLPEHDICACGLTRSDYEARQKRGRTNRSRGNAIEREVARELGLSRVGQYGGPEDAGKADEPFVASVKSGSGYFSERYWDQLRRLPVNALQTPILVVTDAPGPGHKRRAYVVVDLADWQALHGPDLLGRIP